MEFGEIEFPPSAPSIPVAILPPTPSVPREIPPAPNPKTPFGIRSDTGRQQAVLKWGGSPASEAAVARGLRWLALHQESSGQWSASRFNGRSNSETDVAVTGLAVLAFLGSGNTATRGPYKETVYRALAWLRKNQDRAGAVSRLNYSHGIAALALSEALAMDGGDDDAVKKAMAFLRSQQTVLGGWDYHDPGADRSDTSITGWMLFAAKSARSAGIDVPDDVFRRVERHFRSAGAGDSQAYPRISYVVHARERGEGDTLATLAIGLASLQVLGWSREDRWMIAASDILTERGPDLDNLYYTYYATLAQFQMGGANWAAWNRALRDPLIARQRTKGDAAGSWSAEPDIWGRNRGGDVYATAMSVMCLEIYYRYLPIYRKP